MTTAHQRPRYCAVYTRKSSEEGLDQEFNSLDAQREAGQAYVESQRHEGWRLVRQSYDDGGYSGGNMERPALKQLLADISGGKVDVVVVYKVDRLTRSLGDFAKLVDLFDDHGVSFVSVTQQFNTTTSMGRLMLNVLLSFAQFEREVTGERIRDKIAATKRKGKWVGGVPPLGYRVSDKRLVVEPDEAGQVRMLYERYLELGCVTELARELSRANVRTRRYVSAAGNEFGGCEYSRGHLHRILRNRTYVGEIVHKGVSYPGGHEAILDRRLFDDVQKTLAGNRSGDGVGKRRFRRSLLAGKVYDPDGRRMICSKTKKGSRYYRYYASEKRPGEIEQGPTAVLRVPARGLEAAIVDCVTKRLHQTGTLLEGETPQCRDDYASSVVEHVSRCHVSRDRIRVVLDKAVGGVGDNSETIIDIPIVLAPHKGSIRFVAKDRQDPFLPGKDEPLIAAVHQAQSWRQSLVRGESKSVSEIAKKSGVTRAYVARRIRLAYLAPDIVDAIFAGRQSVSVTLENLRKPIPLSWETQRRIYGHAEAR